MNRRNFVRNAVGATLLAGATAQASEGAKTINGMKGDIEAEIREKVAGKLIGRIPEGFASVFHRYLPDHQDIFPTNDTTISVRVYDHILDSDYILLPLFNSKNIDFDCAQTLLSAAVDKNVIAFDSKSEKWNKKNIFTQSAYVTIMKNIFQETVTDLFHGPDTVVAGEYNGRLNHFIPGKEWDRLREFAFDKLHLILPEGKTDFVIAVNRTTKRCIVAHYGAQVGIAVLKNDCVVLGAV